MIVVIVFERKLNWTGFFFTFAPELKLLPHLKGIFVRFGFRNKIKAISFVRMIHKILLLVGVFVESKNTRNDFAGVKIKTWSFVNVI